LPRSGIGAGPGQCDGRRDGEAGLQVLGDPEGQGLPEGAEAEDRDPQGNVVQADPNAFLRAGESRTEVDIKGFTRRWVLDGFTWTPLDVKDKLNLTLKVVEPKARPAIKKGLQLAQRKLLVDRGVSGRVLDVADDPAHQPQVLIQCRKPLSVLVTFDTYRILPDGQEESGGRVIFTLFLKEVPRTPDNMAGLTVVDGTFPESL
jgi:hypothetical protein